MVSAVHGVAKSWTQLSNWATTVISTVQTGKMAALGGNKPSTFRHRGPWVFSAHVSKGIRALNSGLNLVTVTFSFSLKVNESTPQASPARWTWVWSSSGSWWWTRNPGVLQLMGSPRVEHNWTTELTELSLRRECCGEKCMKEKYPNWRNVPKGQSKPYKIL